jgi:hypothetical protein
MTLFRVAVAIDFRPLMRIASLLLGLLITLPISAEEHPEFNVQQADFTLDDTMLMLASKVDIELPDYISIAINQGFAVPLMFEVQILALRNYWFDQKIVTLKQQYQLHYLPMLRSYVVFDLNTGQRRYYDSLPEAVRDLEVVYNYPMLDVNNLEYDRIFYARMRFGIDIDELPLPLKSSSLWDNDWNLQSDWFEWDIERPGS